MENEVIKRLSDQSQSTGWEGNYITSIWWAIEDNFIETTAVFA